MSAPKVIGLDLSLASTGVASTVSGRLVTWSVQPKKLRGHSRLALLQSELRATYTGADLVVLEGPSYGSTAGQQGHHERAGLWWLIAHDLWKRHIATAVVAPSARAKYATGKGNAAKDAVLGAVIRRYADVPVEGNDEADALVLAAMGARHLGQPLEADLPDTHLVAMGKVLWPEGTET